MIPSSWSIRDGSSADVRSVLVPEFTTESGKTLHNCDVVYRSWGRRNADGDNCVVVCHALTGNTDVADWWGDLFGPRRILDPQRDFVICLSVPGSPYGRLSPLSLNPETNRRYGSDFPLFTIRDTVRLHRLALEELGITNVRLAIGGSLGGMQASEWAHEVDFVERAAVVACGGSHSPWCIGWSNAQRAAIRADPAWLDGDYDPTRQPAAGLAAARQIAMMTYRSFGEFQERFGRHRTAEDEAFSVGSYLDYQGEKLVSRFDAGCYLALTQQMDSHDVFRGRDDRTPVAPSIVVGISTDILYPAEEQEALASRLRGARFQLVESPYGHDGFLIEQNQLNAIVRTWLTERDSRNRTTSAKPAACGA